MVDNDQCDQESNNKDLVENESYSGELITIKHKVSKAFNKNKLNRNHNRINNKYVFIKSKSY